MRLYFHEMKSHSKALIIWSLSLIAFIFLGIYEYGALSTADAETMQQMTSTIPESLQVVFGMNGVDLSTAAGYYSVLYFYFLLMAAVYAGMLGVKVIVKEEVDKTAEFLFVKPMSRSWILTCKIKAGFTCLLLFNLVLFAGTSLFFYRLESSVPFDQLVILNLSFLVFQMVFCVAGMFVASVRNKTNGAAAKASVIIFACYLLNVVWQLSDKLEFLKYLTPFSYFPINDIFEGDGVDFINVAISFAIIILGTIFAYYKYNKKDLMI